MGNLACYCNFDNSKDEAPPKPVNFNPRFKTEPKSEAPVVRRFRKLTFTEGEKTTKLKVDISELDYCFGIREGFEHEAECNNDNNLIDVSSKKIPSKLNEFMLSIQERVTADESSNNSSTSSDSESADMNQFDCTPLSTVEKNLTPKPKRKSSILLPKDMATVSLGKSNKKLIRKLKEMGYQVTR